MTDLPNSPPVTDPLAEWIQHLGQTPGRLEADPAPSADEVMPTASVPYGSVVHPDAPIPIRLSFDGEGAVDRVHRLTAVWERSERARAEAITEPTAALHAGSLVAEQAVDAQVEKTGAETDGSLFDVFVRFLAAASTQTERNEIFQALLTDLQRAGLMAEANAAAPERDPEVQLLEDVLAGLRKL